MLRALIVALVLTAAAADWQANGVIAALAAAPSDGDAANELYALLRSSAGSELVSLDVHGGECVWSRGCNAPLGAC